MKRGLGPLLRHGRPAVRTRLLHRHRVPERRAWPNVHADRSGRTLDLARRDHLALRARVGVPARRYRPRSEHEPDRLRAELPVRARRKLARPPPLPRITKLSCIRPIRQSCSARCASKPSPQPRGRSMPDRSRCTTPAPTPSFSKVRSQLVSRCRRSRSGCGKGSRRRRCLSSSSGWWCWWLGWRSRSNPICRGAAVGDWSASTACGAYAKQKAGAAREANAMQRGHRGGHFRLVAHLHQSKAAGLIGDRIQKHVDALMSPCGVHMPLNTSRTRVTTSSPSATSIGIILSMISRASLVGTGRFSIVSANACA